MNEPTVQQQVTQTLAESFNLLQQASFDGIKGGDLGRAAQTIQGLQAVIQSLVDGVLEINEVEGGDDETE